MLEEYFVRPETVDRIRGSWLADPIAAYVEWMSKRGCRHSTVARRVPLLIRFGEHARTRGATKPEELACHVDGFVAVRVRGRLRRCKSDEARRLVVSEVRGPLMQMLRLVAPSSVPDANAQEKIPFLDLAPCFFLHLRQERGLRELSIRLYAHHLRRFEDYLTGLDVDDLAALTPRLVTGFVTVRAARLGPSSTKSLCTAVRHFLRYIYRQQLIHRDLSSVVASPRSYRLAHLPRSITWDEVRRTLDCVDRRSPMGKRDFAILLLMIAYGLRAREIAALTLDDIEWRAERLRIPERKAGHSSTFPLSSAVGAALLDYIQQGRPKPKSTDRFTDRRVFRKVVAPRGPMRPSAVASRAAHYLRKAGVAVRRPGSHTLRHTCIQRLVEADFSLKAIGDFVGHRSPNSTEIYSKVDVETLRQVAIGVGEDVL
ncbi:MAG: tyrosine-type recombinase/integrase [bacterium]|nr:tyrosine-type recombinase/integrase [bacterium]